MGLLVEIANSFVSGVAKENIPTASDLFSGMIAKGRNRAALAKKLKKTFQRCPNVFQKPGKTHEEINVGIVKNTL